MYKSMRQIDAQLMFFTINCAPNSLPDLSRRAKRRLMQAWAKGNNATPHETLLGAPPGAWRVSGVRDRYHTRLVT